MFARRQNRDLIRELEFYLHVMAEGLMNLVFKVVQKRSGDISCLDQTHDHEVQGLLNNLELLDGWMGQVATSKEAEAPYATSA